MKLRQGLRRRHNVPKKIRTRPPTDPLQINQNGILLDVKLDEALAGIELYENQVDVRKNETFDAVMQSLPLYSKRSRSRRNQSQFKIAKEKFSCYYDEGK